MSAFRAFWHGPMGPKTTHFWGPVANWGFVAALSNAIAVFYFQVGHLPEAKFVGHLLEGLVDTQKPPELISGNMTAVQLYQFPRWGKAQGYLQKKEEAEKQ